MRGEFAAKGENLKKYLALVQVECARFQHFKIQQILRAENNKEDRLAKTTSEKEAAPIPESVVLRTIEVLAVGIELLEVGPTLKWVQDILRYLNDNEVYDS